MVAAVLGRILGFTDTKRSLNKSGSGQWLMKSICTCEDSKDKALHGFGTRF